MRLTCIAVLLLCLTCIVAHAHRQRCASSVIGISVVCLEWGTGFGDPYTVLATQVAVGGNVMLAVYQVVDPGNGGDATLVPLAPGDYHVTSSPEVSVANGLVWGVSAGAATIDVRWRQWRATTGITVY